MASDTYWLKQTASEPLFPDLLWSRPENKRQAGKLLIIGGQAQNLSAPSQAFAAANKAGIGTVRVLLPDSTRKLIGKVFPEAEFAPSTPSGSFNGATLDSLIDLAAWADGVLLAGDFGKNSETAVLLEKFADHYKGQLALSDDALDYFISSDSPLVKRDRTVSVMSFSQLHKLSTYDIESHLVLHKHSLVELVTKLHEWTSRDPGILISYHAGQIVVAANGRVSTTPCDIDPNWPELAAYVSVWWSQQPQKAFEALASAIYDYAK